MRENKSSLSATERVKQSYQSLTSAASSLNSASDKLSKSVSDFDVFLKKLALGVSSGVVFRSSTSEDQMSYSSDELWYAKHGGKWGLSIRMRSGDERAQEEDHIEEWPFNEAPRALRVKAIHAVPELLEKLVRDAEAMAKEVEDKAEELSAITGALTESASGKGDGNSLFARKLAEVLESPGPKQFPAKKDIGDLLKERLAEKK